MSFRDTLNTALAQPTIEEMVDQTHELICDRYKAIDPTATVRKTDYFNHSYVPDIVVSWDDETKADRSIFLRRTADPERWTEDLDTLAADAPMIIGLSDGAIPLALDEVKDSLVTEVSALNELGDLATRETRTRDASVPLMRHGHGMVSEANATSFSLSWDQTFDSIDAIRTDASTVDRNQIQNALSILAGYLDSKEIADVESAVRTRWIEGGGDPQSFPAMESGFTWSPLTVASSELAQYLRGFLDSGEELSPERWREITENVTARDIGRLVGKRDGGAFDALATANMSVWNSRHVWVESHDLKSDQEPFAWLIHRGLLGLRMGDVVAYFTDGKHGIRSGSSKMAAPPALSHILSVFDRYAVSMVDVTDAAATTTVQLRADAEIEILEVLQSRLTGTADNNLVARIAYQATGRDFELVTDYPRRRVSVDHHERALPIWDLLRAAFRTLVPESADRRESELTNFLAQLDPAT